jgi:hypothetical protein
MAFESSDSDFTPTVRNTFLNFEMPTQGKGKPRASSAPASSRMSHPDTCDVKFFVDNIHSDGSTYETDGSEPGTRTPMSDFEDLSPACYASPQEGLVCYQNLWLVPPPPQPHTQLRRLNSKAASFRPLMDTPSGGQLRSRLVPAAPFQPQMETQKETPALDSEEDEKQQRYKKQIAEVIRLTRVSLKWSEHIKDVEVSEDADGCWNIVVQPKGSDETSLQTELLLTLAKESLLDAAASSKCIYVMGYCAPKPFDMKPQGFEATLGAMQVAQDACWHVFKKGFCRHAEDCCKQHPGLQATVHVVVEGAQFNSCPRFASAFKDLVADLALSVTAEVGENPLVETVAAIKDEDYQGWSIEITAKGDPADCKEYLLTLAKNALFTSTGNSGNIYILGYSVKPFMKKSHGFVTILGDMQDESRICWDLYSKGVCSRDCACYWEHPECLMPINVVVK